MLRTEFPIVGLGASAGGIQALEAFFRGMPENPGMAFVVVSHLSASHEHHLLDAIAGHTSLAVMIGVDNQQLEPNCVYLLPRDALMSIGQRRLRVIKRPANLSVRRPVDLFLSALAQDCRDYAAGVVLSGGNSDGTLGIKAIKEYGGLTMAQAADEDGPANSEMPASAIASGWIDFALPASEMGKKLVELGVGLSLPGEAAPDMQQGGDPDGLGASGAKIRELLRDGIGHDSSGYNDQDFMRRVRRRMQIKQLGTVDAYIDHLNQGSQEAIALFRDLSVGITNFFKDAEAFDVLTRLVIPELLQGRGATDTVRVWVPGCATGEEAYSLAILLREHMDTMAVPPRVRLFATDVDDWALLAARAARYPGQSLEGMSRERRDRHFLADGDGYVVNKQLRDMCIFAPHSVVRDPPFARIDLISCRNLLICSDRQVQQQVIPTFHYSLQPNGFLLLGASDDAGEVGSLFKTIERKHRIFQRRTGQTAAPRLAFSSWPLQAASLPSSTHRPGEAVGATLHAAIERQVLTRHAPAHVVINANGDVLYYSNGTGKFLQAEMGIPSHQVLTLARKGLRPDLRALLHEAAETGKSVRREGVAFEDDEGRLQRVSLEVEPLCWQRDTETRYLVLFFQRGMDSEGGAHSPAQAPQDGAARHVEIELLQARERLQSMAEEYEAALEELSSSNEELLSVNEELEASKEELVSLNEELHTVNDELHGKVDELDRCNNDLNVLFDKAAIATLFLDRNLIIRSFTPAIVDVFNILPSDCGRPITDLASRFDLPAFANDIEHVYTDYRPVERRIASPLDGKHYLLRMVPHSGADSSVDGVVVTFIDITDIIKVERRHRLLIADLQRRTRSLFAIVQNVAQSTLGDGDAFKRFDSRLSALERVRGALDVEWRIERRDATDYLLLDWAERGSPTSPDQMNQGRERLEQTLDVVLRGKTRVDFNPDGIACRIEIPLDGKSADVDKDE